MTDTVKTAVFGKDLLVEIKDYKLSASGNKISIVPEGAGYFMPEIGPTTFLDIPLRKKYLLFGPRIYERIYFVEKKGAKCVDFGDGGKVYGPDEEQVKKANMALIAKDIGADRDKGVPWYIWAILAFEIFIIAHLMGLV